MSCPSAQQLRQFLNDEISGDDHATLVSHVSQCCACQHGLDELTSGETHVDAALVSDDPELRELINRLREQRLSEWTVAIEPPDARGSVTFAGPTSDAAPLGWLGAYQIEVELGAGTTGQVFAARDSRLGRRVAIKVLRPQWASHVETRSRFEREARAVATLEDPRIVKVFEVGTTPEGAPFIVMEFVDGESLDRRLERDRALLPREAAAIARQIALGLEAAHRRGIVHRDVKPSNLLLRGVERRELRVESEINRQDSQLATLNSPLLKIADFGLARVVEATEQLTQEGFIAGTPAYMSPEQIRRPQDADARSDVYSVGVLLYEMLTGDRPFRGVVRMLLHQALHEEPVPPRRLNDRVPRDLETICLKAMSKEPSRRYATAADLAEDLLRWLEGQPVLARPVGTLGRAWRWCRRNPRLAALNTIVTAVLLAGAVDLARYARPPERWQDELSAARKAAAHWRRESDRHHADLKRLAQAVVVAEQTSDEQASLEAVLAGLKSIASEVRDERHWQTLAVAHGRLAELLAQERELASALQHCQAARDAWQQVGRLQPPRPEWAWQVALLQARSAELSRELGNEAQVESSIAGCLRSLEETERAALNSSDSSELAHARLRVSESLARLGQTVEAQRQRRLGWQTLARMASQPEAGVRQVREAFAATGHLVSELLDQHDYRDARAALEPAAAWSARLAELKEAEFADHQAAAVLLRNLALVEIKLDQVAQAEQRLRQLDELLSRLEADQRLAAKPEGLDWLTSQRRELTELRNSLATNKKSAAQEL